MAVLPVRNKSLKLILQMAQLFLRLHHLMMAIEQHMSLCRCLWFVMPTAVLILVVDDSVDLSELVAHLSLLIQEPVLVID